MIKPKRRGRWELQLWNSKRWSRGVAFSGKAASGKLVWNQHNIVLPHCLPPLPSDYVFTALHCRNKVKLNLECTVNLANVHKFPPFDKELLWSLLYRIKKWDNSKEDFVQGYSLLWELEVIRVNLQQKISDISAPQCNAMLVWTADPRKKFLSRVCVWTDLIHDEWMYNKAYLKELQWQVNWNEKREYQVLHGHFPHQ